MAFTCRIQLDKKGGVTISVEDAQAKTSQTVLLDGKSIVLTCKDQENTSTITQNPDSIAVKCKAFSIDAETIALKSQKETTVDSGDKLTVTSKRDFQLSSDAGATVKAKQDVAISGNNVSAKGTQKAEVGGMTVSIKGDQKVELGAPAVALSADLKLDIKGTVVKVTSDGTLEVGGQMSTFKGQMVNVQGSMVKIG